MSKDYITGKENLEEGPRPPLAGKGNQTYLDIDLGNILASDEVHGLDIAVTGSLVAGSGLVGLNVSVTPLGALGMWRAAIYGKVTMSVYVTQGCVDAAELEFISPATLTRVPDHCVLALNYSASHTEPGNCAPHAAYLWLRKYGDNPVKALMTFMDDAVVAHDLTSLLCSTSNLATTHTIRILIGTTPYWILLSNTGPAA